MKRELFQRLCRFGAVGLAVMLTFMLLNWLFGHWVGEDAAFLLAYPPAVGLHFVLNRRWTFNSDRTDTGRQAGEYLAMVAVTFLIQAGVFKLVTHFTPAPGWLAAGVANVTQMIVTFAAMQLVVFSPSRRR